MPRKGRITKQLLGEITQPPPSRKEMTFLYGTAAMEAPLKGNRKSKGILEEFGCRKEQVRSF